MALIKWKKPNGTKIETNDMTATVVKCESLGWKRIGQVGRPKRAVETVDISVAEPDETPEFDAEPGADEQPDTPGNQAGA